MSSNKKKIEKILPIMMTKNTTFNERVFINKIDEIIDRINSLDNESLKEEEWPRKDDVYCYVASDGNIITDKWDLLGGDGFRRLFGNCFRTHEEAEEARDKVKALLLSLKK